MVTILGHHISLIRPSKVHKPIIYNSDHPHPHYDKRPIDHLLTKEQVEELKKFYKEAMSSK